MHTNKLLTQYKRGCHFLRQLDRKPPFPGLRLSVYSALIRRYGGAAVLRHVKQIKAVLDRAEAGKE